MTPLVPHLCRWGQSLSRNPFCHPPIAGGLGEVQLLDPQGGCGTLMQHPPGGRGFILAEVALPHQARPKSSQGI